MTVVLVHIKCMKFMKAIRGSYLLFVIKHALFPLETMSFPSELLWFVRGVSPNFSQIVQFFYINFLVPCHYIKQSLMYFGFCLNYLEFNSHGTQCLYPSRDTNMFENSFQFTAQVITMHTRTQV